MILSKNVSGKTMKFKPDGKINDHLSIAGNYFYPAYLITGKKKNIMIDAGINLYAPLYYRSLGQFLGSPEKLDSIFLTHSHYDHLGAVPYLKRKIPSLKIGAHEYVSGIIKKYSVIEKMNELAAKQNDIFPDLATDEDISITPFDIDITLKDGDSFDLGGLTLQVFSVPGHTRDCLAFFIPELSMLFPGECAGIPEGDHGEYVQVEFLMSYDSYLHSIRRMIDLDPKIICHAHNWIFTDRDASDFLKVSLDETEGYRLLVESYLDAANGDVQGAVDLMLKHEYDARGTMFQERNAYIANTTAQVKLIASMGMGK